LNFLNNAVTQKLWLSYHILRIRYEFNFIIKNTDAFVMLSERFKEDLYFLAPSLRKHHQKIHGITNPFDCPIINIKETVEGKDNIILFVGRLHIVQKRVDLLMKVWNKLHQILPDWKFWVVGDGDSRAMMENYCLENKLDRVTFFGKDNPNDYYKKAKIFHLTSAYEGFGNVLIEAQSYGCVPLLFNSYSSAQDIVTDEENGILVEPFNIEMYVSQTLALINNQKKLSQMALNAYENVNRFSYDKTYKKWEAVFKSLK
jgi:glycosyltransferase involved in cell wall biosynthesis